VQTFFEKSPIFIRKREKSLLRPLSGLRATYAVHLRLIETLVVDFLLVIIELLFARCFRFVTIHAFDRQTDRRTDRRTDAYETAPA